ncbi:MAG: TonB family protein [Calditrichaeota bacterium]|nr:TonB family protein [Calditrichota bacterium]
MFKRLLNDEKVISVTGTVFVHILLLILFLVLQVDFRPVIEEFAEVTFSGGWMAPSRESQIPVPEETSEETPMTEQNNEAPPEKIELPERRQMDLNEQEIIEKVQPESEKLVTPGNIVKKTPTDVPPIPPVQTSGPAFTRQEKEIEKGIFQKQLDEKLMEGTKKIDIDARRDFEIDWEGQIRREIYQKRLPEFPPDVQREATIKIQFNVLPNGLVGSAVLLQKGDTKLENLTLEAFKTWRFNPLPDYVEQVAQSGVITFHFKLK